MSDAPSVCVIGAGAIGLASALALARRGAAVTVLEARHVAAGSSGLSVGIIETQYLDPLAIELRVVAMRMFDRLEREHGLRIVRNGYLRLAHDTPTVAAFERSVRTQHELGVEGVRVLDRREVAQLVPDMAVEDLAGGLYGPRDGFLDGHLYCTLLAELAAAAGARVVVGRALLGAEPRPSGGWRLRIGSGERRRERARGKGRGRGRGLDGDRDIGAEPSLDCDRVVDAAGPWAGRVAALLGVELPLRPQRHQAVAVHLPRALPYAMPSVMDYTPGGGASGLYFRHERPGQLIAGLHRDEARAPVEDPDRYARAADAEFLEAVAERLAERLPALASARLAHAWAGLYPASPDGLPQVGPAAGEPSVILAGGAGGAGIQLSPVLGELVADWILLGEPRAVADARRLAPSRL